MKIRMGFVSNSSTSSFTCCISGVHEAGRDLCFDDADMCECENGHIMLRKYLIKQAKKFLETHTKEELANLYNDSMLYESDLCNLDSAYEILYEIYDWYYEFPKELCPVCQLEHVLDGDILSFILKYFGISEVENIIREKFGDNPEEFYKFIKD